MFQDAPLAKPVTLEDLSTEDLERMLGREPGSTFAALDAEDGLDTAPKPS